MENAYKKLFWGLIIATVSIHFGLITIFPTFVGWLIVLHGLSDLIDEISDKQYFTAYCSVSALVVLTLIQGFFSISQTPAWLPVLPLLYYPVLLSAIEMTAFHKLLEGSGNRFKENNQLVTSALFLKKDRVYLILNGLSLIFLFVAISINDETLLFFVLISNLIPRIYLLTAVSSLSKEDLSLNLEEVV